MIVIESTSTIPATATAAAAVATTITTTTAAAAVAQPTSAPSAVTDFQWAILAGKALFIQGGSTSFMSTATTSVAEFHSLDLTKPWTDSYPSWTSLPMGPPASANQSLLISTKNNSVIVWDTTLGITRYDLDTGAWGPQTPVPYSVNSHPGVQPVLQPGTDMMFAVTGFIDTFTNALFAMLGYNFRSQLVTQIPMGQDPDTIPPHYFYASVWSTVRNSMLVHGGVLATTTGLGDTVGYFHEYFPENSAWTDLRPLMKDSGGVVGEGIGPGRRHGHCMVEAYNGTKIVVFGGYTSSGRNETTGAIYLLDVATLTWTAGTNASTALQRGSMACACSGDSFVAWGGDNNEQVVSNTPIVYNMRTNQWVHQFDPTIGGIPTFAQDPRVSPSPSSSGTGSSNHTGVIGGTVAAVVIVLAFAAWVLQCRRRGRRQPSLQTQTKAQQHELDPEILDGTGYQTDGELSPTLPSPLSSSPPATTPLVLPLLIPSLPMLEDMEEVIGMEHRSSLSSPESGNQGRPEDQQPLGERLELKDGQDSIEEANEDKGSVKNDDDEDVPAAYHQNPFSNSPQYMDSAPPRSSSSSIDGTTIGVESTAHSLERGGLRGSLRNPQWPSDGKRPSSVTFPDLDPLTSDPHTMVDHETTRDEPGLGEGTDMNSEVDTAVEDDAGTVVVVIDRRDTIRNPQWRAAGDYRTSVTFRPPTPPLHSPEIHRRDLGMGLEGKEGDEQRIQIDKGEADPQKSSFLAFELLMERSRLERELKNVQEKLWRHHIPASTTPK